MAKLPSLPERTLSPDDRLARLLPPAVALPMAAAGIETVEDLYECAAALGNTWFRRIEGLDAALAGELMMWLARWGKSVGEVTPRFFPPGSLPAVRTSASRRQTDASRGLSAPGDPRIRPIEQIELPEPLSGKKGLNRAPAAACALSARDDLEAIRTWLNARAGNPNTHASYRKEAERFLLWSLVEKETALSDIRADEASQYLRWLEDLGRTDDKTFSRKWRIPQAFWIGEKNAERSSAAWRPYNGPLSPASRSLTPEQWSEITGHLSLIPEGLPRERMKLILMLGKSLGLRASEMLEARTGWIVRRSFGGGERPAIEVIGKGSKVRRLPLTAEQLSIINQALAARGIPEAAQTPPDTPLLVNLGRGRNPGGPMSRSGLYRVLESFFDRVADEVALSAPLDAAKLRASSTHWLRHTFAVSALKEMSVNVVQAAMGHASVATTGRYLSPEEAEMSEAMSHMKAL